MGKIDPSIPGYSLTQSGDEVQEILDNVAGLKDENVTELIDLLTSIKGIIVTEEDDSKSVGQQLLAVLDTMVNEDEVQTEVNDSTYPASSKAVKTAIETHKTAATLDHPDKSVTTAKIADSAVTSTKLGSSAVTVDKINDGAVSTAKLADKSVTSAKLADSLSSAINNSINEQQLLNYVSIISKAPKYKLSDLRRENHDSGYDLDQVASSFGDYFILKNDSGTSFGAGEGNGIFYNDFYEWQLSAKIEKGKTYLCILQGFVDTGDENLQNGFIEVVTEMGSDIIDLQTVAEGWKGVWHYGTDLTHIEGRAAADTSIASEDVLNAKVGDYYLNSVTYSVYHTDNGTDWLYIGNLAGGINENIWAKLNSPNFSGIPTAPTPTVTNNSTQLATTEFVRDAIDKYSDTAKSGISTDVVDNVDGLMNDVYGYKSDVYEIYIDNSALDGIILNWTRFAPEVSAPADYCDIDVSFLSNNDSFTLKKNGVLQTTKLLNTTHEILSSGRTTGGLYAYINLNDSTNTIYTNLLSRTDYTFIQNNYLYILIAIVNDEDTNSNIYNGNYEATFTVYVDTGEYDTAVILETDSRTLVGAINELADKVVVVDNTLKESSTNPVQNKIVTKELGKKVHIYKISDFETSDPTKYEVPFEEGQYFVLQNDGGEDVNRLLYDYNESWYNPNAYYWFSNTLKAGDTALCYMQKQMSAEYDEVDGHLDGYSAQLKVYGLNETFAQILQNQSQITQLQDEINNLRTEIESLKG